MKRHLLLASIAALTLGLSPPVLAKNLSVPPGKSGSSGGATGSQNQPGGATGNYGAAQPDENAGGATNGGETQPEKHKGSKHKKHDHHEKHGKHR